jgi:hypothetical protein
MSTVIAPCRNRVEDVPVFQYREQVGRAELATGVESLDTNQTDFGDVNDESANDIAACVALVFARVRLRIMIVSVAHW